MSVTRRMKHIPATPATPAATQQRAEAHAADFLARHHDGEAPDLEDWTARLDGEGERHCFRQLVEDALQVSESLPAQRRAGSLLARRWRLLREIGSGRTGMVFAARDQETGQEVAVKLLAAFTGGIPHDSRFARECRALAAFGHPSIAAVQEIGHDGGLPFLVTDLVEGQPLGAVLQRVRAAAAGAGAAELPRAPGNGLPLVEALRPVSDASDASHPGHTGPTILDRRSWWRSAAALVADVAATVEAGHACGLVHGGLKPGNLVLRKDGSAIVLDFGLAGALDPAATRLARSFFGTEATEAPDWPGPEPARSDPRGDVYQLGLVLYELLTLRGAFGGAGPRAAVEQAALGDFCRPREHDPRIPHELEAICLKATQLWPERRYPTMAAMREDLQRYLAGRELPLAALQTNCPRALRVRYALRRHRAVLWLGGALAAALALAAFVPG
jgi:eukaryotic-like serine/threonine-protein kinase